MLTYNAKTGDYFLPAGTPDLVKRAGEVGLTMSLKVRGPRGEPIYFTKEPYAALPFWDMADAGVRAKLTGLQKDYEESFAKDASITIPRGHGAVEAGHDYMPFQRAGVAYAEKRDHTLIGDEMGLGKTLQGIGFANRIGAEHVLCIVPASIRLGWKKQIQKWSTIPRLSAQAILKSKTGISYNANYTIISYELASNEETHQALCAGSWDLIILDEVHYLKQKDSRRAQAVFGGGRKYKHGHLVESAKRVIGLSGTPLPNRPRECWTIAKALHPEAIDWMSFENFCFRFNPSARGITDTGKVFNREERGRLAELQTRLRCNFMIRRLKKDVLTDLPDKRYEITYLEADGKVKDILRRERLMDFSLEELTDPFAEIWGQISTIRREMGEALIPQFIQHAKMLLDVMELPKLPIFFHHKSVMDAFASAMEHYGVVQVRGGVSATGKERAIEEFCKPDGPRIFMGQNVASGVGIDGLQKVAAHAVLAEPDWVPGVNDQIVDRLHRIGQHGNVLAQLMCTEGSILERILATAIDKSQVIHESLDERHAVESGLAFQDWLS